MKPRQRSARADFTTPSKCATLSAHWNDRPPWRSIVLCSRTRQCNRCTGRL